MHRRIFFFSLVFLLWSLPLFAGTIYGFVNLKGTPPPLKKITVDKDGYCKKSKKERPSEALLVSKNGKIKNVVLSLEGVKGSFPAPEDVVVIDQKECSYLPHITVIQAGTAVDVQSSDPVNHNVRSNPEENEPVNYAMPEPMVIPLPDLLYSEAIRLTCDIHKWMSAYIVVTETPFFDLTDKTGSFEIKDVPEGTYTLRAWHEKLGVLTREVVVPKAGKIETDFIFSVQGK
ncbi:MAG: hypothetical protein ACE5FU_05235 [Nitrospinota bacterium]